VPDNVLRLMRRGRRGGDGHLRAGLRQRRPTAWNQEFAVEADRLGVDPGAETPDPRLRAWAEANPRPHATIADVVAHIQHVRDVAGVDHVGLGGDFDGVDSLPDGITGVDAYPRILAALMANGWTEADIRKLAGENVLRTMRAVEAVAASSALSAPAWPPRCRAPRRNSYFERASSSRSYAGRIHCSASARRSSGADRRLVSASAVNG
jgi:membrane dipeptidase